MGVIDWITGSRPAPKKVDYKYDPTLFPEYENKRGPAGETYDQWAKRIGEDSEKSWRAYSYVTRGALPGNDPGKELATRWANQEQQNKLANRITTGQNVAQSALTPAANAVAAAAPQLGKPGPLEEYYASLQGKANPYFEQQRKEGAGKIGAMFGGQRAVNSGANRAMQAKFLANTNAAEAQYMGNLAQAAQAAQGARLGQSVGLPLSVGGAQANTLMQGAGLQTQTTLPYNLQDYAAQLDALGLSTADKDRCLRALLGVGGGVASMAGGSGGRGA